MYEAYSVSNRSFEEGGGGGVVRIVTKKSLCGRHEYFLKPKNQKTLK